MGVEKGTRLLIAQHQAAGTASPLLGAEARAKSPEERGVIRAVIDESFPEPAQTPEVAETPAPLTLRARVRDTLQTLSHSLIERTAS